MQPSTPTAKFPPSEKASVIFLNPCVEFCQGKKASGWTSDQSKQCWHCKAARWRSRSFQLSEGRSKTLAEFHWVKIFISWIAGLNSTISSLKNKKKERAPDFIRFYTRIGLTLAAYGKNLPAKK